MQKQELIPHLFRTEYRKIVSVLCRLFGIDHIEIAEDIVSDTFLLATELWGMKGPPENPAAWLYTVSKNKTKDYLKRNTLFLDKISTEIKYTSSTVEDMEIDLSSKNINDSQLAMMFAICHPCISPEAQIALSLNLLCGFSTDEIANAFLTNRETIYKRLQRAKEKLKTEQVKIEQPSKAEINERLERVLTTLYLLFNEGYYSSSKNTPLRKELCLEAMRLNVMLANNEQTNKPPVNALLALMCFHASRFEARTNSNGEVVLYGDQDTELWDLDLIEKGNYYINIASQGDQLSKYHLEAAIAYWHTQKDDSIIKWERILQLYNQLLLIEYSPIAALNRTYALAKSNGNEQAIIEAEKLDLKGNHLYHSLLANLYASIQPAKAFEHFEQAILLAKSEADKVSLKQSMLKLKQQI
ncbi:MAG: sigma-70 family RNA polymerase sigma factor [Candidatus Pedobacter colombiensis]|uniref:Sigma-70 family RNA polymerase sigma factor n=1 Tax=Candidatus Pedobacter colombiensis TaxID=3121371 RepID=A0AAJ6B5A5_9SPHI|nr:sigma-70 family RNA polymerase sigma factor [Pedobacter sp.]WEK17569.1 MAG: sigma-70 family RNA polymerase sigma factor [Pedobacter sp.]